MKPLYFSRCVVLGALIFASVMLVASATAQLPPTSPGAEVVAAGEAAVHPAMGNPAAVYCREMGYGYGIEGDEGQRGLCTMPDGRACDAWEFLKGKCGQSYSYCAQQGYEIMTVSDGKDSLSPEYAVCLTSEGVLVGSVTELSNLSEKTTGCGGETPNAELPLMFEEGDEYVPPLDAAPPTAFDWRTYLGSDWLTPVKDQGTCGSCWAFSAVGVSEAAHNIASNDPSLDLDLSEQYLVADCSSAGTCCGGYKDQALRFIRDSGVPDEACMSYVDGTGCSCDGGTCDNVCMYNTGGLCSDRTCSNRCADWSDRLVTIESTGYVGTDPQTIKQALVDIGPLAVSMGFGDDYGGYWDGDIYRCLLDIGTNHAVIAVGYSDAGGYWLIKNSWGTGWGDGGYFKLGYGECYVEQYVYYADASPPGDAYEPDDTWDQANWIYDGSPQTHSIAPVGDVDWVRFSLDAESEIVLETSGASGDTRMWLYDSGLSELDFDDDGGQDLFSRIDRLCGVDALPAGTYYVKIDEYGNNDEIPSYDIDFTVVQACASDVGPLEYDSHLVDDDTSGESSGNDDGVVDCGETIELNVTLRNQGTDTATGVAAALSTTDSYIFITDSQEDFPDIAGGGTGEDLADYDFVVEPDTPDGHIIHFDLDITASNGGPWTDSFDVPVTCSNNPPYTPSSPSPPSGATGVSVTTDLSWNGGDPDSGDTVTYDVYFEANDSSPENLVCDDVSSPTCDPGTLSDSTHYYWYVVATDNHGASTSGPVWDFTTGSSNNPPNTPSSPTPADDATGMPVTTDLSWTGGDPDAGDTVTYDVYFEANDSSPDNLVCDDVSSPSCDPGTLSDSTHYYWYVVATDNHGASTSGPVWDFTTGSSNNPPYTPSSPTPADGATGVSVTTDLSWTGGDPDPGDTVTYDVYFEANDSSPDDLICNDVTSPTCDPGTLTYSTHYYWYVAATDNHGASTSGPVWDFMTAGGDAYEPDNTSGEANWIYDGSPQTHSISPVGDVDWVKFSLDAESEIVLETSGPSGDTRMWLYDSGLTQLDYDDDGGVSYFSRIDRLCGVDALPAGTYYVRIEEYLHDDEIPSYNIAFTVVQSCHTVYLPVVLRYYD